MFILYIILNVMNNAYNLEMTEYFLSLLFFVSILRRKTSTDTVSRNHDNLFFVEIFFIGIFVKNRDFR
jgi:hypothetical protein